MDNKFETAGNAEQNNNERTGWEGVAAMANNFQPNAHTTETAMQSEAISQPEKVLTADNNVYREIAKNALMNWNGMSSKEADERISGSSIEELESQVYAQDSIRAAINGIDKALEKRGLNEQTPLFDDTLSKEEFFDDILNYEKNVGSFKDLGEKLKQVEDKEEFTLDVLSSIHNDWIKNNSEKINDPSRIDKRYQFMPLELIGIDEAKSDLIFVEPIFEAAGMEIDKTRLGYKYAKYGQNSSDGLKRNFMDHAEYVVNGQTLLSEVKDNNRLGRESEDIINGVNQYFAKIQSRYNFKIDLSNVKDKKFAEFTDSYADSNVRAMFKKNIYAAEVADQVCSKLV